MIRRIGCIGLIVVLIAVGAMLGNFVLGWTGDGPNGEDRAVVIAPGTSMVGAARQLEEQGFVRSAETFLTRAKLLGSSDPIKAGEFMIPAGASNAQILAILQGDETIQRLVTIPEGMPSVLVHEKLMAAPYLTGEVPVPAEGSILPESYSYQRGETRAAVLKRMQEAMTETIDELWAKRAPTTVVTSKAEAITLASIVEKETGKPSERRMVAGVYSNRLRQGIMLQADPTIIYPITQGRPLGRRIRRSEINAINDYNTYSMVGLPKGPIANPGRASIEAVLNPAETKALYFVADGTGGHIFADTLAEHNANVAKWYALRRQRGEIE